MAYTNGSVIEMVDKFPNEWVIALLVHLISHIGTEQVGFYYTVLSVLYLLLICTSNRVFMHAVSLNFVTSYEAILYVSPINFVLHSMLIIFNHGVGA